MFIIFSYMHKCTTGSMLYLVGLCRGWNINIRYFNDVDIETTDTEHSKESSMSDKFNLVLQVARQVQVNQMYFC